MSQTIQLKDTFTGSSGTNLTAHNPNTGTASSWTAVAGSLLLDGSGGVYAGTSGANCQYVNTTTMASNSQLAYISFNTLGNDGTAVYPALVLRAASGNGDYYQIGLNGPTNGMYYSFNKYQGGSYTGDGVINNTVISASGNASGAGVTTSMIAIIQTVSTNVHVRLYIYNNTYGWSLAGNWTDTTANANLLTNNKQVGLIHYSTIDTASHGVHFTNLTVYDYQIAAVALNASGLTNAYSPLQWYTTSTIAQAMIVGSEMNFSFTGTSLSIWMSNNWWNTGTVNEFPLVAYSIDNGPQVTVQTTIDQSNLFVVSGLSNATHTCRIVYLSSYYGSGGSRWTPALTSPVLIAPTASLFLGGFDSFVVDSGATVSSSLPYTNHMIVLGDSIAELDYSNTTIAGSYGDPRTDWSFHIGDAMGLNTIRLTYAGTGYYYASGSTSATSTNDGVPAVGTYWPSLFSGTARPYSSIASNVTVILCCHGVNDLAACSQGGSPGTTAQSNVQTAAQNLYSALLSAFPNAIILVYIPFGQAIASVITAAVTATASNRVKLRNLGPTFSTGLGNLGSATYQSADGTHPNTITHTLLKAGMAEDIKAAIGGSGGVRVTAF